MDQERHTGSRGGGGSGNGNAGGSGSGSGYKASNTWESSSPQNSRPPTPPVSRGQQSIIPTPIGTTPITNPTRSHSSSSSAQRPSSAESLGDSLGDEVSEKKRRTRVLMTRAQSMELQKLWRTTKFPTSAERDSMGLDIGLSGRQVQVWFQNQRQKSRRHVIQYGATEDDNSMGLYDDVDQSPRPGSSRKMSSDSQPQRLETPSAPTLPDDRRYPSNPNQYQHQHRYAPYSPPPTASSRPGSSSTNLPGISRAGIPDPRIRTPTTAHGFGSSASSSSRRPSSSENQTHRPRTSQSYVDNRERDSPRYRIDEIPPFQFRAPPPPSPYSQPTSFPAPPTPTSYQPPFPSLPPSSSSTNPYPPPLPQDRPKSSYLSNRSSSVSLPYDPHQSHGPGHRYPLPNIAESPTNTFRQPNRTSPAADDSSLQNEYTRSRYYSSPSLTEHRRSSYMDTSPTGLSPQQQSSQSHLPPSLAAMAIGRPVQAMDLPAIDNSKGEDLPTLRSLFR